MAKTLLNAVNDMFRMAELISGDAAELTSLTDSARQGDIDYCVISLRQTIDELYTAVGKALPEQQAEDTITLVAGERGYTLADNFIRLHWPLLDTTNSQFILQFSGEYDALLRLDIEQDDTGVPVLGVIRPTDSKLYVYPTPTAQDDGKVYTYQYDREFALDSADDEFPFNDVVYRAVTPAAFQLWKRERRDQFDQELFKAHIGRAARLLPRIGPRANYSPR